MKLDIDHKTVVNTRHFIDVMDMVNPANEYMNGDWKSAYVNELHECGLITEHECVVILEAFIKHNK